MRIADAVAPDASVQLSEIVGIPSVVVLPVIATYIIGVYWVFRGKIGKVASKP